jgi:hypothetical protein
MASAPLLRWHTVSASVAVLKRRCSRSKCLDILKILLILTSAPSIYHHFESAVPRINEAVALIPLLEAVIGAALKLNTALIRCNVFKL